ncbi:unnamed protein product [Trichogramma brassicae]|uniref:Uncharacterized protein n=1 Tax=Trichogramma brassicae TaxID=86971 RepID=A0A6H5I7C9_9HYME|nr:unnamed protein product [Trichogramma brassicae]
MPSLLEALERKYGDGPADCCCLTDDEQESPPPPPSPPSAAAQLSGSPRSHALSVSIFIPKKSPRHTVPALLVLQDCDIECAGADDEKLRNKCRNVEELDLAQNKLSKWDEVFGILRHMPKIKFVNLSFNSLPEALEQANEYKLVKVDLFFYFRLCSSRRENCYVLIVAFIITSAKVKDGKYDALRNLVLNGTRVSWSTVQGLVRLLRNLEELHLSLNDYKTVDLGYEKPENCNPALKKLHFTGNPVEYWREIAKLGYAFPGLESLVLAECPIRSLNIEESESAKENAENEDTENRNHIVERNGGMQVENGCSGNRNFSNDEDDMTECESDGSKLKSSHDPFRNLRFLNVNGTLLANWDDIERIARFPALKSLRIQGCPLFESPREYTEHERRQLLIARLPNVETLNGGGVISSQEREDAERAFIRHYMDKPEAERPNSIRVCFETTATYDDVRGIKVTRNSHSLFNTKSVRNAHRPVQINMTELNEKLLKLDIPISLWIFSIMFQLIAQRVDHHSCPTEEANSDSFKKLRREFKTLYNTYKLNLAHTTHLKFSRKKASSRNGRRQKSKRCEVTGSLGERLATLRAGTSSEILMLAKLNRFLVTLQRQFARRKKGFYLL